MATELADVRCGSCGVVCTMHARTVRAHRATGRGFICGACRLGRRIKVDPASREWAHATLAAMSDHERALVTFAFGIDE